MDMICPLTYPTKSSSPSVSIKYTGNILIKTGEILPSEEEIEKNIQMKDEDNFISGSKISNKSSHTIENINSSNISKKTKVLDLDEEDNDKEEKLLNEIKKNLVKNSSPNQQQFRNSNQGNNANNASNKASIVYKNSTIIFILTIIFHIIG